jgi:hypothetical protein
MLNRYPAWHPHAYVGATLSAGVFKGGATNADVEAFYAALPANQFEPLPAGVTPLKTALIAEYGALVAAYGTEAAARAAWLAVAAPVPLKAVRFETGSVGATYLATQPEEVQKLIPIWNDLLGLTLSIQEGAMNDIYKRLSKVKKL